MANVWLYIVLFAPLLSALGSYFMIKKYAGINLVIFSTLVLVAAILAWFLQPMGQVVQWDWMILGREALEIGLYYDPLAGIMTIVVAIVAWLVAIFSLEYMKHDGSQPRYFALLGIFAFSMYGIVLSSNLLLTFVCWELVGFSSYLLIGFWFEKEAPALSSMKAFLMNKIGDVGFLMALFILYAYFHTLDIQILIGQDISHGAVPYGWCMVIGIGLFLAAVGKSAQFPLQTWLPDAMTGPTPVSALIHAATMVAAGVYLMVRVFPLLAPEVLTLIGIVGGLTAFMGAFAAFAQNDIKKILAYSTVSQLGYMIMAVGAGFPLAAFFHLTTHAFFKAGLFLCAGSIIHYFHETHSHTQSSSDATAFDAQDITQMGGLRKVLPITFLAFTICMLSLAGLPLLSGFLSKEMILNGLVSADHLPAVVLFFGFASVFMTAAYMTRLYFKVFFNGVSPAPKYAESLLMTLPLGLLSLLSMGFVFSFNFFDPAESWLLVKLAPYAGSAVSGHHVMVLIGSLGLAGSGLLFSYLYVEKRRLKGLVTGIKSWAYDLSHQNFFVDVTYKVIVVSGLKKMAHASYWWDRRIVDRLVNLLGEIQVVVAYLSGWLDKYLIDGLVGQMVWLTRFAGDRTRKMQGGNLQHYLTWAIFGLLLIFYFLI